MAVSLPPPYPRAPIGELTKDPITQQPVVMLTKQWAVYHRDQRNYLAQVPVNPLPSSVEPETQPFNNSIGTTAMFTPTQAGIYSVEYAVRVVTAAGVSSSIQVAISWTDGAITQTKTFTAVTGNTTTSTGSERYSFRSDGGSPITYTTTYASNPANAMFYELYLVPMSVAAVAG